MQEAGRAPRGEARRLPPALLFLSILAFPGTALPHAADAAACLQARSGAGHGASAPAGDPATPADAYESAPTGAGASAPRVRVEVRGVGGEVEENVRAYLSIAAVEEETNLLPSRIRRLHGEAEEEIRRALQPFGYYRPEVRTELSPAQGEDGVWAAVYQIEPGEPMRLGSVEVRLEGPGADEPELAAAVEEFPLEEGDHLLHAAYREGKMFIRSRALELGFLRPAWSTSRLEVDLVEYRADVRLALRTGPRFELGEVRFEQDAFQGRRTDEGAAAEDAAEDGRFSEAFLRRFVPFEPGDAFTTERLLALQQNLVQSEYFEMVEVSSLPQERDGPTMAYLLLGRPLSRASREEGEFLANAAQRAGIAGGDLLAARLASTFGLDEARVEGEDGGASLMLGETISPNLYIAYSLGLFEASDVLLIRYEFGRGWILQTETGFETSADLLYTSEP